MTVLAVLKFSHSNRHISLQKKPRRLNFACTAQDLCRDGRDITFAKKLELPSIRNIRSGGLHPWIVQSRAGKNTFQESNVSQNKAAPYSIRYPRGLQHQVAADVDICEPHRAVRSALCSFTNRNIIETSAPADLNVRASCHTLRSKAQAGSQPKSKSFVRQLRRGYVSIFIR